MIWGSGTFCGFQVGVLRACVCLLAAHCCGRMPDGCRSAVGQTQMKMLALAHLCGELCMPLLPCVLVLGR